ncbi:glycosyltransferase family 4 protein [Cereibacter sphaeroides]|uniref:glycosyltransferase family 4 protein n=1 Tax=Cereibacter sphaeroides TaxID=1063 RepID=UPI003FCCD1F3
MDEQEGRWIVCQIGARENYSVARTMQRRGALELMVTDVWFRPGNPVRPLLGRAGERSHTELATDKVWAPTRSAILREIGDRISRRNAHIQFMHRNAWFQRLAVQRLEKLRVQNATVFAYSYAAADIMAFAKRRGWRTVLGQIDPGPFEARLVDAVHEEAGLKREVTPVEYWNNWRRETELADAIVVNSAWSKNALVEEGVSVDKISVLPLVYEGEQTPAPWNKPERFDKNRPLRLLFLGQVILRKGIDLVLEAMRLLPDMPLQLDVVGTVGIPVPATAAADPRIRFHGAVPRSATRRFYRQADLFLFPTRSDGFGLTQLEALSAGVPVIASERCGEVVEDGRNGAILRALDAGALAKLLDGLAADPAQIAALRHGARLDSRFALDSLGAHLVAVNARLLRSENISGLL